MRDIFVLDEDKQIVSTICLSPIQVRELEDKGEVILRDYEDTVRSVEFKTNGEISGALSYKTIKYKAVWEKSNNFAGKQLKGVVKDEG
jgi:TRAP-type mannitol/chloroaromatic compound transport system substrate-binding protein